MKSNQKELNNMLEDIKYIRSSIQQNGDKFRQIIYNKPYRLVFWIGGLSLIIISSLFYYFTSRYGGFNDIPFTIRVVLISVSAAALILISAIKLSSLGFMQKVYREKSLVNIIFMMLGRPLFLTYIIMVMLMAYFSVYFIHTGQAQFIYPVIAIGIGLLFTLLGSQFAFLELMVLGLLFIVPSAVSVNFIAKNPQAVWPWIGFTFGFAFFTFGIYIECLLRLQKGRNTELHSK
jgi:hypothetical protein